MKTLSGRVTARDMRTELARVLDRVDNDFERLGVTRNGRLTAVLISVEDLKLLEKFEAVRDAAEYAELPQHLSAPANPAVTSS